MNAVRSAQRILDDCAARGLGGGCRIVCTQPRRISAVGVAERVARERCEAVGRSVGYRIRLEARECEDTRLTFCTTGVLLRRLLDDPDLRGVSHVIVDEVRRRGTADGGGAWRGCRKLGLLQSLPSRDG